jgi:hypothetical protein
MLRQESQGNTRLFCTRIEINLIYFVTKMH